MKPLDLNLTTNPEGFQPYARDPQTLARPWAVPGTPGLEHRVGGIEKANITGNVSYDPENHDLMVHLRAEKVARIGPGPSPISNSTAMPPATCSSSAGAAPTALSPPPSGRAREEGKKVSAAHLRYLNPFPRNLGDILTRVR